MLHTALNAPRPRWETLMAERDAHWRKDTAQPKPWRSTRHRFDAIARFGCYQTQDIRDLSFRGRTKMLHCLEVGARHEAKLFARGNQNYERVRHRNYIAAHGSERLAVDDIINKARAAYASQRLAA